ncbi:MAG: UDP-N-acetylglucosamine 2-epimerase (non-hydrolyzing) [Bacteroidetes bacterium]|nr:UDP-N-acetylglucosamine 2-epimerase (non-hydrolyzing) [Bacteroidota bacterium]
MTKKRIFTIIGARPQIIKSSALSRAIRQHFSQYIEEIIVHTGQHYDANLSDVFFEEMQIPKPKYNLEVGSGNHGAMTARMIEGLEKLLLEEEPDAVVIYGDTNSTLAGAIAAAKIHIPVVHIEAGLRSFNKAMPEELNRITSDHMSTLLFTPTKAGLQNLEREGFDLCLNEKATIDKPNIYYCGDIMLDNSKYFSEVSQLNSKILKDLKVEPNSYVLCTIHRDSNTDSSSNLTSIFRALIKITKDHDLKVILPIHPRTRHKMQDRLDAKFYEEIMNHAAIKIIPPAGFLDVIALEKNARIIITDSGGLQKEAFFFQKPCVVLREETEWIEIVQNGNAKTSGADLDKICRSTDELLKKSDYTFPSFYGDGKAADFIVKKIIENLK